MNTYNNNRRYSFFGEKYAREVLLGYREPLRNLGAVKSLDYDIDGDAYDDEDEKIRRFVKSQLSLNRLYRQEHPDLG